MQVPVTSARGETIRLVVYWVGYRDGDKHTSDYAPMADKITPWLTCAVSVVYTGLMEDVRALSKRSLTVRARYDTVQALHKATKEMKCRSIAELLARVEAGDVHALAAWQRARWGK